jgi:catechol 2,3-dioxygenase-like lactoylglutathione lyase family enzyme
MKKSEPIPILHKIDCVGFYVPDLDAGLAFYRDRLGLTLFWRAEHAIGLRLPDSDGEIVLQDERPGEEIDFKVHSADEAARQFAAAGGTILVPPFETQIGRGVVVQDPWGHPYVLLDISKGLLVTDENGNVTGNQPVDQAVNL